MAYSSFEELEVRRRGTHIAARVYKMLGDCLDFGLKDQMTRAAVSISSNIAEGTERGSTKEFIRFLHIAKGSAAELKTQLHIAYRTRTDLISDENKKEMIADLETISRNTHRLIESIKNNLKPNT
jgi:four helix bundle protein